jgi:hypothetical protein
LRTREIVVALLAPPAVATESCTAVMLYRKVIIGADFRADVKFRTMPTTPASIERARKLHVSVCITHLSGFVEEPKCLRPVRCRINKHHYC